MKRNFLKVLLALPLLALTVVYLSSCEKEHPKGKDYEDPTVTLDKGEVTEKTLAFTINPSNADECAWWYGAADQTIPSAEDILAIGVVVNASESTPVLIEGLEPTTDYVIVAAVSGSGKAVASDPLKMRTGGVEFEGVEFMLLDAIYSDANAAGAGKYSVAFGNAMPDQNGDPVNVGDMLLVMELYNAASDEPMNAVLPDGEYNPASDMSAFTWDVSSSYLSLRTEEGEEGVQYLLMTSGIVEVARNGNFYTVNIDVTLLSGDNLLAKYEGPIQFIQGATSSDRFSEPQNVTFTEAQGRYYGNWFNPFCDDMNLEFFAGEFDANNTLTSGYYLFIPCYMNKLVDTSVDPVPIENGVYSLSYGYSALTYVPMTYKKGELMEFLGEILESGTYMIYKDPKTGRNTLGLMVDGSVKISGSGSAYNVEFDFVTEEGVSVKGTFNGNINIQNYCNNSSRPETPSTLTEDYELNFPDDTQALAYYMGDYLHVGLDSWLLYFMGETPGDIVTLEFFTESGNQMKLAAGTYTVSNDFSEFKANQIIPGFFPYGGGELPYSWYGDTSSNDNEGYSERLAPISGGTLEISTAGDGYLFDMKFTDDKGNAIIGGWTGMVDVIDLTQPMSGAGAPARMPYAPKVR